MIPSDTILFKYEEMQIQRSSYQRCSVKKSVLKNFAKFTGKHLYQSLSVPQACNFIKKETLVQVFSCKFCAKFLRTPFLQNTSRPLLLDSKRYLIDYRFFHILHLPHASSAAQFFSFNRGPAYCFIWVSKR